MTFTKLLVNLGGRLILTACQRGVSTVNSILIASNARKAMDILVDWDMVDVKRYMAERMGYDDRKHLDAMEIEYKRFIALCFVGATLKDPMIMTNVIDPMWHTHILFTCDYTKMCQSFGKEHLHHEPAFPDELALLEDGYNRTKLLYSNSFGTPSTIFWPEFAQICGGSGCSCSGTGND